MAKRSSKDPTMTSYHKVNVYATPEEMIEMFGEPVYGNNDGEDKTNMEWVLETTEFPNEWDVPRGTVFTIYDWKEYRPLSMNETVQWHIGAHNSIISWQAQSEIENNDILNLEKEGMDGEDINLMRDLDII